MSASATALSQKVRYFCAGMLGAFRRDYLTLTCRGMRSGSRTVSDVGGPAVAYRTTFPACAADSRDSPVVVVLGWLHGADKNLSKYSDFYGAHGCITVRVQVMEMVLDAGDNTSTGSKIVDLLAEKQFSERNVVVHVLSNGGCTVLLQMLRRLQADPLLQRTVNIRGTIFDSAPGRRRIMSGIRAFTAHIVSAPKRWLFQVAVALWLVGSSFVRTARSLLGAPYTPTLYDQLRASYLRQPELYVYSKADKITRCEDIRDMIAFRGSLGIDVSEICWDDSEHVSHLRRHRDEYIQRCLSFVDSCCKPQASL